MHGVLNRLPFTIGLHYYFISRVLIAWYLQTQISCTQNDEHLDFQLMNLYYNTI